MSSVAYSPERTDAVSSNPAVDHDSTLDHAAWLARAMDRVSLGDVPTFQEVYRRTSAKLFGICLRILVDRPEAEDALQETYVC